jgi:hypothetical protein
VAAGAGGLTERLRGALEATLGDYQRLLLAGPGAAVGPPAPAAAGAGAGGTSGFLGAAGGSGPETLRELVGRELGSDG